MRPLIRSVWGWLVEPRSVAGNAAIRFGGTLVATFFMAATGIIVARVTGPDGKGAVATLSYLVAVVGPLATLGLGDAAVVMVRRRGWDIDRAARAAIWPTVSAAVVGGLLVWPIATFFPSLRDLAGWSLPLVVLAVIATSLQRTLSGLGEALGEIPFTSVAIVVFAATTTAVTFLLVIVAELDVAGAIVAFTVGPAVSVALLLSFLRTRGVHVGPRPARAHVTASMKFGVPMELAQTIQTLSSRADMLIVYAFVGVSGAGLYSVALTVGELVRYAPAALAVAAFPALADEPSGSAHLLARRVTRTTVAAGVLSAVVLALAVPWAIPRLFGPGFRPSVTPALLLLAGGIIASTQWGLTRAAAAVGHPRVILRSHATSLLVMIALDAALIPKFGLMGAAIGSIVGPAVGLSVALRLTRNTFDEPTSIRWFVPGREEFVALRQLPRRLIDTMEDASAHEG